MNKILLVGNIGNAPEIFKFENGNVKTSFSVATKESWKDKQSGEWQEKTTWHNIVMYRETKLQKGDLVSIEGKITYRSYEDKDGNKKYTTEIVSDVAKLLHRKK
jgi:single-strand DNA-binding protein